MSARLSIVLAGAVSHEAASNVASQQSKFHYAFFKSRIEPIFLKKREDHARCFICHEEGVLKDHLAANDRALDTVIFPDSATVKPITGLLA